MPAYHQQHHDSWSYVRVPRGVQVYVFTEGYIPPAHGPRGRGPRGYVAPGYVHLGRATRGHAPPDYAPPDDVPPGYTPPGDGHPEGHHSEQSTEYTPPVYDYDVDEHDHSDYEDDDYDDDGSSNDSSNNDSPCDDHQGRNRNNTHGDGSNHRRGYEREWGGRDRSERVFSYGRGWADTSERGFSQGRGGAGRSERWVPKEHRRADRSEREFPRRGGHGRQEDHGGHRRERFVRGSSRAQPNRPPRKPRHHETPDANDGYESPRNEVANHYKTLGVPYKSSTKDIAKAAKEMRIKVHPDKLIKPGMPETEIGKINDAAARVGQAAEILLDPVKRAAHDEELRDHYR